MELSERDVKNLMAEVGLKESVDLEQLRRQEQGVRRRNPDRPGSAASKRAKSGPGRSAPRAASQPDPLQTSFGYLDGRKPESRGKRPSGGGGRSAPAGWMGQGNGSSGKPRRGK